MVDITIINFIQNHFHCGFTDYVFPMITALGDFGAIWIGIGLCLVITKKYRRYGIFLFAALALTYVLGDLVMKPIVARPRPFVEFPGRLLLIPAPQDYSFPSGHAASSFSAATILWRANRKFGITGFILAGLIAFSRMFLFVHYPSDVLAGVVLGILCALLVTFLVEKRIKSKKIQIL